MLLPFVKCCLLLQLSMLRSTLQVLLLLFCSLCLCLCYCCCLFTWLLPVAFCLLLLVMSSDMQEANREAHTSGSGSGSAHGHACSALHSALSWNLHSDFSTYYVPWRLLLVALCALRYALMLSNCCLL